MVNKYSVRITPRARQNLNQIVAYLRENASNQVANKVRDGIIQTIDQLESNPEIYQVFSEVSTEQVIFRRALKWDYKIVYTVDKNELLVLVVRIYNSRQNPRTIIEELKP